MQQPQGMKWEPVQRLVSEVLNGQISGEDALQALKPYTKSPIPAEQLYGLTVLDALVVNCPVEILPRLTNRKWRDRIVKTANESLEKSVCVAAAQLIANWAHFYKGSDFGMVYQEVARELKRLSINLPKPMVPEQIEICSVDYFNRRTPKPSSNGYYKTHRTGPSPSVLPNGFHKGMDFTGRSFQDMVNGRAPLPADLKQFPPAHPHAHHSMPLPPAHMPPQHYQQPMPHPPPHHPPVSQTPPPPRPIHTGGGKKPTAPETAHLIPGGAKSATPMPGAQHFPAPGAKPPPPQSSPTPDGSHSTSAVSRSTAGTPQTPENYDMRAGAGPEEAPGAQQPANVEDTVRALKCDIKQLLTVMAAVTRSAQAVKSGNGDNRSLLEYMNQAWMAAERCRAWQEKISGPAGLLSQEGLPADQLKQLIDVNDFLSSSLQRWDSLVQMDLTASTQGTTTTGAHAHTGAEWEKFQSEIMKQLGDMTDKLTTSISKQGADVADVEWSSLREQNDILKKGLSEAEAARRAALAASSAEHQRELTEVKSQAVQRIKELMGDLEVLKVEHEKISKDREALMEERVELLTQQMSDNMNVQQIKAKAIASSEDRLSKEANELREQAGVLRQRINECELELKTKEDEIKALQADVEAVKAQAGADLEHMQHQLESARTAQGSTFDIQQRCDKAEGQVNQLQLELRRESILRKKAYNEIREMKGNIRVIARLRPPYVAGLKADGPMRISLSRTDEYSLHMCTQGKKRIGSDEAEVQRRAYEFDHCFGPDATQEQVYAETEELVVSAFDGYNVCVFCYGQTGGGKTHTIMGDAENPGIIYRAIDSIFDRRTPNQSVSVRTHMLELYKDQFLDLLGAHAAAKVKCKTDANGTVIMEGAKVRPAPTAADLKRIFEDGNNKRKTASTKMNIYSSRSHLVFTILLEVRNSITQTTNKSKITFVDLAGSERVVKSGSVNVSERMEEAKAINKSLSALGDVVSALTQGETFVPYRNHKITELMRDSIGGNAKTLMIVNVSPTESDSPESKNSLDYAQRVKAVTNDASKSVETRENARLKAQVERLQQELRRVRMGGSDMGDNSSVMTDGSYQYEYVGKVNYL